MPGYQGKTLSMRRGLCWGTLLSLLLLAPFLAANDLRDPALQNAIPDAEDAKYVARIRLHTPEELKTLFEKAKTLVDKDDSFPHFEPIAVILHGPELRVFARNNFQMYRSIVELAASLEAFNVIDVQACEVEMRREGITRGDLPAFVDTVPFGPVEEQRLLKKGYQYF